jgi:hypothetical protein
VHLPITLNINIDTKCNYEKCTPVIHDTSNRIAWNRVTDGDKNLYRSKLEILLNDLSIPNACFCIDVQCKDDHHAKALDEFCEQIIQCCIDAGSVFPKKSKKKRIPYWSDRIKPLKDDAIFWNNIWLQCNKPDNGIIYELMKKTKHAYHYGARKIKRQTEQLRRCKMAEAIHNNRSRDFWSEVKKVNSSNAKCPLNVKDKTNDFDIASLFAAKYKTLYNSVPSDMLKMENVRYELNMKLDKENLPEMAINDDHIRKALKHIKCNKSDHEGMLFSNHILYASERIYYFLSRLFIGMITHGYTPTCLLKSAIISIPKDSRGNLSDDENYRGIALCSSLFKLFELVLIGRQGHKLDTSDMQYAYKSGHSTNISTMILKSVVNHYVDKGSNVYCCFIDASKAFDRLRYDLLFELLLQNNVNPLMIRLLINTFERQTVKTKWMATSSDEFHCQNGVRQGGILSPLLYSLYNDVLLKRLQCNGSGCWIGNNYYGALSYADDLCILSPTVNGLQDMLDICTQYGIEYDVMFNPKKTRCLKFSRQKMNIDINVKLCGQPLVWVDTIKYLGNWLTSDLSEKTEIEKKVNVFYGNVNNLKSTFKNIGIKSIAVLFSTYCCHYYGSQTWRLDDKNVSKIYTAWNKAVRHLLDVPYTTHTRVLPYLLDTLYIKEQIYLRSAKMIETMIKSNNHSIRFIANNEINNHLSIIGENWNTIKQNLQIEKFDNNVRAQLYEKMYKMITPECALIVELINILDGNFHLEGFTKYDVIDMLHDICTM